MKKALIIGAVALTHLSSQAAVTISINAELLKDFDNSSMPVTGLAVLVASTTDAVFNDPTSTSFVTGDDIELKRWNLSAWSTVGALSDVATSLSFSGNWNAGDPLQLYWYPSLTLASTQPLSGTHYGTFRSDLVLDNSTSGWVTPSDGTINTTLNFYTQDALFLNTGGANLASAGVASQIVAVPEPTTYVGVFGFLSLVGMVLRKYRR
jgi:hypothetical protein